MFLKLVAQLERYDQIEPVGLHRYRVPHGIQRSKGQHRALYGEDHETLERISDRAAIASLAFDEFRQQQTVLGGEVPAADKATLRSRLEDLNAELNRYLAAEYGIDPRDSASYAAWSVTHQPFHWFVEFYGIMKNGGFDVLVGNPPYVEYSKVRKVYRAKALSTERCGNLYALCTERGFDLLGPRRRFGFSSSTHCFHVTVCLFDL